MSPFLRLPPPPRSGHHRILCDRVLDGATGRFGPRAVEVRDGRFASVEPLAKIPEAQATGSAVETIDLRGFALIPPLIEGHAHAYLDPWPLPPALRREPGSLPLAEEISAARGRLREALLSGIGTVCDLGDPLGVNLSLAGLPEGEGLPAVLAAGAAFHRAGRYGRYVGKGVDGLPALLAGIRAAAADPRVSLVKLVATGVIRFDTGQVPGAPQFTLEELRAAVDLARSLGRPAFAHASGAEGVRLAAEAGAHVEHGFFMDDATVELLSERSLAWTPTFAPVHAQWLHAERCGHDEATRARLRGILDGHAETLRRAHAAGVRILPGSDAGAPGVGHGAGLHLELRLMQEAGIPAEALLRMSTAGAADCLGIPAKAGRIVSGLPADFLVVEGPLHRDIAAIEGILWIVRGGKAIEARLNRAEGVPA